MSNMTLNQVITNALQIFTPQLQGGIIGLSLILALMYCIPHGHYGWLWTTLGGSALFVSIVWIGQTVYGVNIG